jgi:eukaryotic-like serine/threonine-protein kinase
MTDGPTRLLLPPDELRDEDRPTRSVPIKVRHADRPAPFTMTLGRGSDPVVPGYRVLGRLGRGGMGVVYKAIHLALNRPVALKMLGGNAYESDPETRSRFRKEAEALASLRHPNIVPVYEVGEVDGLPFFTMELVEGGDLATRLRNHPTGPPEAARIAAQLARGVQAAHDTGILHRDLKPSNILMSAESGARTTELTAAGTTGGRSAFPTPLPVLVPKIADFGLAKRFGAARGNDRTMTQAGDILGTPSYMAPEQAEGHGTGAIGPAADVYAVGAILYEMLVGRPPFEAEDAVRTVIQVLNDDPTPPARLAHNVPRDLETICLKCLQKDPRKRYQTAALLAEDLDRFLVGRPIVARPVSPAERLWKWARRHPSVAALLGTTVAAVIAALVGTTSMWMRANERAEREGIAHKLAEDRGRALEEQKHETDYRLARGYLERGLAACQSRDVPRGLILMAKALEMTETLRPIVGDGLLGNRVAQLERVVRTNLSAWQCRLQVRPRATFHHPQGGDGHWVLDVDLSPDGKRAVLGSIDGRMRLFNAETNEEIGSPLQFNGQVFGTSFSPDSQRFLVTRNDKAAGRDIVQVWDANTREPIGPELPLGRYVLEPRWFEFPNAGFVTDELLLVQQDATSVRFFKPGTDEDAAPAIISDVPITVCLPLPGQEVVITGHPDGSLRRWDVRTGMMTAGTRPTSEFVWTLTCTPDGKRVVAGHWRGTARAWDGQSLAAVGPAVRTMALTEAGGDAKWRGFLRAVDILPDGKTIVTGGGMIAESGELRGFVQSWDAATGIQIYSFAQPMPAWGLAVSGDGSRIISAAEDCTIRVFNAFDGSTLEVYTQRGNPAKVVMGRDGHSLMAADLGADPGPLLADLGPAPQAFPAIHLGQPTCALQYSTDGSRLIAFTKDAKVQRYDPATGKPDGPAFQIPSASLAVKLGPDGRTIAVWQPPEKDWGDQNLEVWDMTTNSKRFARTLPNAGGLTFLSDGGMIVAPGMGNVMTGLAADGTTRWTYQVRDRQKDCNTPVAMDATADGRVMLLSEAGSRAAFVLNGVTGEQSGTAWELPAQVNSLAVHPTGRYVVFAFQEGFIQAYDLVTRARCGSAVPWRGRHVGLTFTADGNTLFVRSETDLDQEIAAFDPITGLPLGPPLYYTNALRMTGWAWHPNSRVVAFGDTHGIVRFWNAPAPMAGNAARIRCEMETTSRTELLTEPAEIVQYLDDAAVGARRQKLRLEHGAGAPVGDGK